MSDGSVLHVYGLVDAGAELPLLAHGVMEAAVAPVHCAPYTVLCSRHARSSLGEEVWRERGEDPEWVTPIARAHHEVLRQVVLHTDVLPLRLPGVYDDYESVRTAIASSLEMLEASFDVIRGHVEWGVKLFAAQEPATPPAQARPTSGHDFFRQRAEQRAQKEQASASRHAMILDIHTALADAATHAAISPTHDRALSGHADSVMVLNAAYLVARGLREQFFGLVDVLAEQCAADGYTFELTGPWPPYSFTHVVPRETERA